MSATMQTKDARIKELSDKFEKYEAAWVAIIDGKDARIRDLEALTKVAREAWTERNEYVKRLEEAFLKLYINEVRGAGMPADRAEFHAKECLEKIAALKEISISERATAIYRAVKVSRERATKLARQQLEAEHPEAMR